MLENNRKPICFIRFGDEVNYEETNIEYYWGYEGTPISNKNFEFLSVEIMGKDVYFLVEKNALFEDANGKTINVIFNIGDYSKKDNPSYIRKLYLKGVRITISPNDNLINH